MTTFGLDVSHYQSGLNPDAVNVRGQGFAFLMAKASEGTYFSDPAFHAFKREAHAEGMLFAAYHFLTGENAEAQADRCASAIRDKSIPVMIDCEAKGANIHDARAFRAAMHSRGYRVTLLYLPHWYWERIGRPSLHGWNVVSSAYPSARHRYASALYPGDRAAGWAPYGSATPAIYQFASSARVSGYSGNVDVDAFRGTVDELASRRWFKDYRPPRHRAHMKAPERRAKRPLSRVQRFRAGHVLDTRILAAAAKVRPKAVRVHRALAEIRAAIRSLPHDHNPHSRVQRVRRLFHATGKVDMPLLRAAVDHGRTGKVRKAYDRIDAAIRSLPAR